MAHTRHANFSAIVHFLPFCSFRASFLVSRRKVTPHSDQCYILWMQCNLISHISSLDWSQLDALGLFHQGLFGDGGTRGFHWTANLHQVIVYRNWKEAPSQFLHFLLPLVSPSYLHQLLLQCARWQGKWYPYCMILLLVSVLHKSGDHSGSYLQAPIIFISSGEEYCVAALISSICSADELRYSAEAAWTAAENSTVQSAAHTCFQNCYGNFACHMPTVELEKKGCVSPVFFKLVYQTTLCDVIKFQTQSIKVLQRAVSSSELRVRPTASQRQPVFLHPSFLLPAPITYVASMKLFFHFSICVSVILAQGPW